MTDTQIPQPTPDVWLVAYGIDGYGPDGPDNCRIATDLQSLCDILADELARSADAAEDIAHTLADPERGSDYAGAWAEHVRAEGLANLADCLDYSRRAAAPAYANDPAALADTLWQLIGERFPVEVSPSDSLYVWEADPETAAEWLAEISED